jgi:hypothetical protein
MAIQVTLNKQDMWNLAQPLMQDLRRHLGDDFLSEGDQLDIGLAKDGNVFVVADDMWFFHEPNTKALTAARRGENGVEVGGIDADGTIRWGEAIFNRASMN